MESRVAMEPLFEQSELRCIGIVSLNQSCKYICEMFRYLYYVSIKGRGIP